MRRSSAETSMATNRPRCVLDTNVLISAGLTDGTPLRVLLWVLRRGQLLLSAEVLEEFASRFIPREKFERYTPRPEREAFVATVREGAEFVVVTTRLAVCTDPDDDRFVELAVDGRADCLVTGNARHFPAEHGGVPVLTPAAFAERYL